MLVGATNCLVRLNRFEKLSRTRRFLENKLWNDTQQVLAHLSDLALAVRPRPRSSRRYLAAAGSYRSMGPHGTGSPSLSAVRFGPHFASLTVPRNCSGVEGIADAAERRARALPSGTLRRQPTDDNETLPGCRRRSDRTHLEVRERSSCARSPPHAADGTGCCRYHHDLRAECIERFGLRAQKEEPSMTLGPLPRYPANNPRSPD
jgi:hypothetical protein